MRNNRKETQNANCVKTSDFTVSSEQHLQSELIATATLDMKDAHEAARLQSAGSSRKSFADFDLQKKTFHKLTGA